MVKESTACCRRLQGRHCSSPYLSKVAPGAGGIQNLQFHFFVGTKDEDSAARHGHTAHAKLGVDHAEMVRQLSSGVGDDGVVEGAAAVVALDVLDPAEMVLHTVAGQGDNLLDQSDTGTRCRAIQSEDCARGGAAREETFTPRAVNSGMSF
jgi:hypothetical protein